jgi:broad specificity phosphatase PhoE
VAYQQVLQRADLRERNLGLLTGLTYAVAPQQQPAAWAQLQAASRDVCIDGGGESRNQLEQRAVCALQQLADAHAGGPAASLLHLILLLSYILLAWIMCMWLGALAVGMCAWAEW